MFQSHRQKALRALPVRVMDRKASQDRFFDVCLGGEAEVSRQIYWPWNTVLAAALSANFVAGMTDTAVECDALRIAPLVRARLDLDARLWKSIG